MTDTRDRILGASAELLRRQGYAATGVKQIVAEASAPFSSLYHFFPGGKEELGVATVRRSGELYGQLIAAVFDPAEDVVAGTRDFFAGAASTLEQSGYADACPIATVALEVASTSEPLREATAEVFESWVVLAAARFATAGIDESRARDLAVELLCALEGAFVLARAWRSTEPLRIAGASATASVEAALGEA